jgi:hypothetical protein
VGGTLLVGSIIAGVGEACRLFAPDFNSPIALEVSIDSTVEQADTLRGRAILHTAGGDTTTADSTGTRVYWETFAAETLAVVDSTRGVFIGVDSGITTIEAYSGNLRTAPISIHVTAAADTLVALSALGDTVSVGTGDSLSDSLEVEVADTVTPGVIEVPGLAHRRVAFTLTPVPLGPAVVLVTSDTTHAGALLDTVYTDSTGLAAVQVRYGGGGTLPDSIVVTAQARRAVGTPVAGSPVSFVVHLTP